MNQAASSLADRRDSEELYKMKDFYRQMKAGTRKSFRQRSELVIAVTFLEGMAEDLTSADQVIPD